MVYYCLSQAGVRNKFLSLRNRMPGTRHFSWEIETNAMLLQMNTNILIWLFHKVISKDFQSNVPWLAHVDYDQWHHSRVSPSHDELKRKITKVDAPPRLSMMASWGAVIKPIIATQTFTQCQYHWHLHKLQMNKCPSWLTCILIFLS